MLPFFEQELSTSCVAACVRMALGGLDIALTEAEIRSRCGHKKAGMRLNQISSCLADLPVTVEYHLDWGLDDLSQTIRKSIFPIVGIDLRPIDGRFAFHAIVIVDVKSDHVLVHDPLQKTGFRPVGLIPFDAAWKAADRETVIIMISP